MLSSTAADVESMFLDGLLALAYLTVGTAGIALLVGWALKHLRPLRD
jgi:hypothetical protein